MLKDFVSHCVHEYKKAKDKTEAHQQKLQLQKQQKEEQEPYKFHTGALWTTHSPNKGKQAHYSGIDDEVMTLRVDTTTTPHEIHYFSCKIYPLAYSNPQSMSLPAFLADYMFLGFKEGRFEEFIQQDLYWTLYREWICHIDSPPSRILQILREDDKKLCTDIIVEDTHLSKGVCSYHLAQLTAKGFLQKEVNMFPDPSNKSGIRQRTAYRLTDAGLMLTSTPSFREMWETCGDEFNHPLSPYITAYYQQQQQDADGAPSSPLVVAS